MIQTNIKMKYLSPSKIYEMIKNKIKNDFY